MASTSDPWLRGSGPGAAPPPGGPQQSNNSGRPQHTNNNSGSSSRSSGSSGGWLASLKRAAKALKREVLAVYYAMQAPDTPLLSKCLAALVLAYALSPLDLIPDFIPVLGILDDLVLVPLLIWAAMAFIPKDTMEAARRRAEQEPLRLSRNWATAVLILLLWTGCLEWLVYFLVQRYGTQPMKQYMWYGMGGLAAVLCIVFGVWMLHKLAKERRKRAKAEAEAEEAVRQRLLPGEGEEEGEAGTGVDVESGGQGPGPGEDRGQGDGVHGHVHGHAEGGGGGGCCGGEGGSLGGAALGAG